MNPEKEKKLFLDKISKEMRISNKNKEAIVIKDTDDKI